MWPVIIAVAAAGFFITKKSQAGVRTGPIPAVIPLPAGWRRAKGTEVTKDALAFARERVQNVKQPGYFETRETSSGTFGALTEWHYHDPNGPLKPWGWHRGITILVRKG